MESTFPHYHGPASLPSDYALLSRLANLNGAQANTGEEDDDSEARNTGPEDTSTISPRRSSFPASRRPKTLTMASRRPSAPIPTETSALLAGEEQRNNSEPDVPLSDTAMFWEELRTLTTYALPVFGFVLVAISTIRYAQYSALF